MTTVRIATRGSELALAQSGLVARRIEEALGVATELVPVETTGDRLKEGSLAKVGGKGLFVKEVEEAILEGRADVAIHSAKDLPAAESPGLTLAAFPERGDSRDALVGRVRGATLDALSPGARVGTGSLRRTAQLLLRRPDLAVVPLRGNVPTRLGKLEREGLDAVVLACAGLERLGLAERIDERLDPAVMLPAVAQGALAVQARVGDPVARDLAALSDERTEVSVRAERGFLAGLGGDCTVPLAALAEHTPEGTLFLRALLLSPDGKRAVRHEGEARPEAAVALGAAAAEAVRADGGDAILAALQEEGAR